MTPRATRHLLRTSAIAAALVLTSCTSTQSGSGGPVVTATPRVSDTAPRSAAASPDPEPDAPATSPRPTAGAAPATADRPAPVTPVDPLPPPSGGGAAPASTSQAVSVFWLGTDAQSAVARTRTVTGPGVAAGAVRTLIAGPNEDEVAAGLHSAIPADTLLLGLAIADGTATVDLSREFETSGAAGSTGDLGKLALLTYTLTQFPTVDLVRLHLDGEAIDTFSGHGIGVADGLRRSDFNNLFPIQGGPGDSPVWHGDEFPVVSTGGQVHRVVRVAEDDFLNIRNSPGVTHPIIGRVGSGTQVPGTGEHRAVGGSTWLQLDTPAGRGWVNGSFLTPDVSAGDFPEAAAREVVDELGRRFRDGEDISSLVSAQGLWISHHAPPVVVARAALPGILADPTTRRWGSKALEPGSSEIRPQTFAQAVAESFVDAWDDDNGQIVARQTIEGPNGRPARSSIPAEFRGFPWITVHDPGDDPTYGGLDWLQWIVSLEVRDGALTVVGLTKDEWAP